VTGQIGYPNSLGVRKYPIAKKAHSGQVRANPSSIPTIRAKGASTIESRIFIIGVMV